MEKLYEELIMCIINVSNGFPFLCRSTKALHKFNVSLLQENT